MAANTNWKNLDYVIKLFFYNSIFQLLINWDLKFIDSILGLVIAQLFLSGLLTTFTFTLMMETSFLTPKAIQATHFSLLATCEVFGKLLFQPLIAIYADKFGFTSAFVMFCVLYLACIVQFQFRSTQLKEMKELKVE
jgi:hypothetical protein